MLLIVVYVGAVAVLFLFVVMMLDVDFTELLKQGFLQYLPFGALIGLIVVLELILIVGVTWTCWSPQRPRCALPMPIFPAANEQHRRARCGSSTRNIVYYFQVAGHGAAHRDDRRHRADAAPSRRGVKRQVYDPEPARTQGRGATPQGAAAPACRRNDMPETRAVDGIRSAHLRIVLGTAAGRRVQIGLSA